MKTKNIILLIAFLFVMLLSSGCMPDEESMNYANQQSDTSYIYCFAGGTLIFASEVDSHSGGTYWLQGHKGEMSFTCSGTGFTSIVSSEKLYFSNDPILTEY